MRTNQVERLHYAATMLCYSYRHAYAMLSVCYAMSVERKLEMIEFSLCLMPSNGLGPSEEENNKPVQLRLLQGSRLRVRKTHPRISLDWQAHALAAKFSSRFVACEVANGWCS